ncbi:hypothetical protein HMPREF9057_00107 [Actinomyces sp. oral taxon 171 str. F0337]|nr:hypothetical protein HMPREF9057_00107 [Actinomyces sp. oral taxon 171 str. F0337]
MTRPPTEATNRGFRCCDGNVQETPHLTEGWRHPRITLQVSNEFQHRRTGPGS